MPVREEHSDLAHEIKQKLLAHNIRVEVIENNNSLGKRINHAKSQKVPYVIVVGDKEKESGNLTIETRGEKLENISLDDFIKKVENEVMNRVLN